MANYLYGVKILGTEIIDDIPKLYYTKFVIFRNADLTGANFTNADLTDADLTGANFTNADLTNADLTNADLTGANFTNADLTGANLNCKNNIICS